MSGSWAKMQHLKWHIALDQKCQNIAFDTVAMPKNRIGMLKMACCTGDALILYK